ncbi:ParB/RepB/Spo0J family partition protein [Chitinimonas viridis]|uniref:ParB/RepB/Spo0J family partition protein n=2 Tax=Chitinimonas TaxID=240411 RepID=A0ABT8B7M6_9NEIS|nr:MULTISPECIES: ParB/RepB/Spo0J family partition protein [Chitinimonas]MDN3578257.1 ParB/RepB/Spo0J family partition protein [Chitinimonas viridis]GLR12140.1 chromosome partitioning protein ParB [Chitinimonas prasina]
MAKLKGLGRGLDALLGSAAPVEEKLQTLPIHYLQPGKYQPRSHMDEHALADLAESIRTQGVIQPVLVRETGVDRYEIIAGERRWRAAQKAGLTELPAVVRKVSDEVVLVMALIENIQRENLNPLEEAVGLQRLIDEFGMTHEACAHAIGKSRSAVTNLLRLLNLAEPVRELLMQGAIDMGHARALLTLPVIKQVELARMIAEKGLSVRETEKLVQALQAGKPAPAAITDKKLDPDLARLQEDLSDKLGAKVQIAANRQGRGKVTIEYGSLDQLDSLLNLLRN